MSLLSDLGLEFVNPTTINSGLKQLKPTEDPQIFSVILKIPGLENTTIRYSRHNFYNQIKKYIRCSGGACCAKAEELNDWLEKLPEGDQRKRQKPRAQTRYILPVVLYQGKSAQAYGGPIEVRYIDISAATYREWDQARAAVNEDLAPFYQRDFIMTQSPTIKGVPVMTHLESKAKWLTDPSLNAEVSHILSNPNFINDYVKVVPAKMDDNDFLRAWNAAMRQPVTAAEQAINAQTVQPAFAQPAMSQQVVQPVNVTPAQPVNVTPVQQPTIDMNVMNTPQVEAVAQPTPTPEAVQPTSINTGGLPISNVAATAPSVGVPFTPQNIITGAYNTGTPVNSITPEVAMNIPPVQIPEAVQPVNVAPAAAPTQPAAQPAPAPTQPAPAPAQPTTSQSEINLANIGDLDAIINSLPPQ